jgi:hypothetical protein
MEQLLPVAELLLPLGTGGVPIQGQCQSYGVQLGVQSPCDRAGWRPMVRTTTTLVVMQLDGLGRTEPVLFVLSGWLWSRCHLSSCPRS